MVGHLSRPVLQVHVQALLGDIDLSIGEPAVEIVVLLSKDCFGELVPLDLLRVLLPVALGVRHCPLKGLMVRYAPGEGPRYCVDQHFYAGRQ